LASRCGEWTSIITEFSSWSSGYPISSAEKKERTKNYRGISSTDRFTDFIGVSDDCYRIYT